MNYRRVETTSSVQIETLELCLHEVTTEVESYEVKAK